MFLEPYKFWKKGCETMGRKRVKPPDIGLVDEKAMPRFVSEQTMCEKYELSGPQCRELARAANAFFEIRKASLIDRSVFEAVYKDELKLRKLEKKVEIAKQELKSFDPITKEYMRYDEAADYFSMSLTCFKALAKEAHAVRHIGGIALINIDVICDYIEEHFVGGD